MREGINVYQPTDCEENVGYGHVDLRSSEISHSFPLASLPFLHEKLTFSKIESDTTEGCIFTMQEAGENV